MIEATIEEKIAVLKSMLSNEALGLYSESEWAALASHIENHKYLINQNIAWTITWEDAVFSWYENVYTPLMRVADWWEVRNAFPGYSRGQLMFALSSHWYYLNESNGIEYSAEEAANSFAASYGKGIGSLLCKIKGAPRIAA